MLEHRMWLFPLGSDTCVRALFAQERDDRAAALQAQRMAQVHSHPGLVLPYMIPAQAYSIRIPRTLGEARRRPVFAPAQPML